MSNRTPSKENVKSRGRYEEKDSFMFGGRPQHYQGLESVSMIFSHLLHCDNMGSRAKAATFSQNNVLKH